MLKQTLERASDFYRRTRKNLIDFNIEFDIKDRRNWVEEVLGISEKFEQNVLYEEKVDEMKYRIEQSMNYNPTTGIMKIKGRDDIYSGMFIYPSADEIIKTFSEIKDFKTRPNNIKIEIQKGRDVGDAIKNASNGDTFQVASQFNALEMINQNKTPMDGINIYVDDHTQGPRAAMAVLPGTFVRNYLYPIEFGTQFNALRDLGLSHLNGYLVWGNTPEKVLTVVKRNIMNIRIPAMIYAQVIGITENNGNLVGHRTGHRIHQVFSSAVPVDSYMNSGKIETQMNIAKIIIDVQYRALIALSCLLHYYQGSTESRIRINLTLIGTGAFRVPRDVVIDILNQVLDSYSKYPIDLIVHGFSDAEYKSLQVLGKKQSTIAHKEKISIEPFAPEEEIPMQSGEPFVHEMVHDYYSTVPQDYIKDLPIMKAVVMMNIARPRLIEVPPEDMIRIDSNTDTNDIRVQGDKKGELFTLNKSQELMLNEYLNSDDNPYLYSRNGVKAVLFTDTFGHIGYINERGMIKFFVNIEK